MLIKKFLKYLCSFDKDERYLVQLKISGITNIYYKITIKDNDKCNYILINLFHIINIFISFIVFFLFFFLIYVY